MQTDAKQLCSAHFHISCMADKPSVVVHSDHPTSSGVISGHGNQLGLVEQLRVPNNFCMRAFH